MNIWTRELSTWDLRGFEAAHMAQGWSKDPSVKVGCSIFSGEDNSLISVGFNGFPPGVEDKPELLADKTEKLLRTIHAEDNALEFCGGRSMLGAKVFVTHPCCGPCAAKLVRRRVGVVICDQGPDGLGESWQQSISAGIDMMKQAEIPYLFRIPNSNLATSFDNYAKLQEHLCKQPTSI